jgi:co-chaperonin GroES (HSP10)
MPLIPLGRRVLVEPLPPETEIGSIKLPDYMVEKQCQGYVRGISSKYGDEFEFPKVGDKVYYRRGYGQDIELNGVPHVLIAVEDVLGVLT